MMSDKHLVGGLHTSIATHIDSAFAIKPDLKRKVYDAAGMFL